MFLQAHAHVNSIKIHNQWRRIMRMAKTEELREEIEILAQSHEREVDRKDAVIQVSQGCSGVCIWPTAAWHTRLRAGDDWLGLCTAC